MMSEWLDIMLSEISRKRDEENLAEEEAARRVEPGTEDTAPEKKSS